LKAIRKTKLEVGEIEIPVKIFPLFEEKKLPQLRQIHKSCSQEPRKVFLCKNCKKEVKKTYTYKEPKWICSKCNKEVEVKEALFCPNCQKELKNKDLKEVYLIEDKIIELKENERKEIEKEFPPKDKIRTVNIIFGEINFVFVKELYALVPDTRKREELAG